MTKKKIIARTINDGWVAPKTKKKRKPMTEEQKVAAAERLEKARAARKPAKNDSIHYSVLGNKKVAEIISEEIKKIIISKEML